MLKRHKWQAHQIGKKPEEPSGEQYQICTVCGTKLKPGSKMKHHMRTHTQQTDQCPICDKKVKYLSCHMMLHNGKTSHICGVCGSSFKTKSKLTMHEMTHTGEKPFKCDKCDAKFNQKGSLKGHVRAKHDITEYEHKCVQCDKRFISKVALKVHSKVHEGSCKSRIPEWQGSCNICGKTFNRKQDLKIHFGRVHSTERPHVCVQCKRAFAFNHDLVKHMTQMHVEGNTFCCMCNQEVIKPDASLSAEGHMREHMRKHIKAHTDNKHALTKICAEQGSLQDNANALTLLRSDEDMH